jgi:hypothetical protein
VQRSNALSELTGSTRGSYSGLGDDLEAVDGVSKER